MTPSMDAYRLWAGVLLAFLVVGFLMIAFFRSPRMSDGQREILRFLCALCAGASGYLITGEALFQMKAALGTGGTLAVSGTAGFALFFVVWYGFRRTFTAPDAFSISIADGWTFEAAAQAIARNDNAVVEFVGFTAAQLKRPLARRRLQVDTPAQALESLGLLVKAGILPKYEVTLSRPRYIVRALP